jgi:glyceraldehyde-3-phosphate dehydrogenase/erythrose-4-phosphate dehydrogenase
MRVPVPTGSVIDLTLELKVPVSKEAIVDKVAPSKLKSSAADVYTVKLDDIISITQNHKK